MGSEVCVCIVVTESGNKDLEGDVRWNLADYLIDAYVRAYTVDEFEDLKARPGTAAYDAVETGYLAYERKVRRRCPCPTRSFSSDPRKCSICEIRMTMII